MTMNKEARMTVEQEAEALAKFTEYFVENYPGPNTIISNPRWHAPKIFNAAKHALASLRAPQSDLEKRLRAYAIDFGANEGLRDTLNDALAFVLPSIQEAKTRLA